MTDYKQLCAELVDDLELCDWPYKLKEAIRADIDRARAALAVPERLTVQEISNLPKHGENYIYEFMDDKIQLDGDFSRADLQQLADSIPNNRSNSNTDYKQLCAELMRIEDEITKGHRSIEMADAWQEVQAAIERLQELEALHD